MLPEDYAHPVFAAATIDELEQQLQKLRANYEIDERNQAYRILRTLNELAPVRKGLR